MVEFGAQNREWKKAERVWFADDGQRSFQNLVHMKNVHI